MTNGKYYITNETTEDRFDEVDNLDEAIRIARRLVSNGHTGDPISIEHDGRVVRQFVLTSNGVIEEPALN